MVLCTFYFIGRIRDTHRMYMNIVYSAVCMIVSIVVHTNLEARYFNTLREMEQYAKQMEVYSGELTTMVKSLVNLISNSI